MAYYIRKYGKTFISLIFTIIFITVSIAFITAMLSRHKIENLQDELKVVKTEETEIVPIPVYVPDLVEEDMPVVEDVILSEGDDGIWPDDGDIKTQNVYDSYGSTCGKKVYMFLESKTSPGSWGWECVSETQNSIDNLGRTWMIRQIADPALETTDDDLDKIFIKVFDHKGNVIQTVIKGEGPNGNDLTCVDIGYDIVQDFVYDKFGRIKYRIDPEGYITDFREYDSLGRVSKIWRELGDTEPMPLDIYYASQIYTDDNNTDHTLVFVKEMTYTPSNLVDKNINALGNYSKVEFDSLGRVIKQLSYDSSDIVFSQVRNTYNNLDMQTSIAIMKDPNSIANTSVSVDNVTEYVFSDLSNNLEQVITYDNDSPLQLITTYYYDNIGRNVVTEMPDGSEKHKVYNFGGHIARKWTKSVDSPISPSEIIYKINDLVYNKYGNVIQVIQVPSNSANIANLIADILPLPHEIGYPTVGLLSSELKYNGLGQLLEITDNKGFVTKKAYNSFGQLHKTVVDPSGIAQTTVKSYDRLGRLKTISGYTDESNSTTEQLTEYVYTLKGQVRKIIYPDCIDTDEDIITYNYFPSGLVSSMFDRRNTHWHFIYDAIGNTRLKSVLPYDGDENSQADTFIYSFEYNAANNMTLAEKEIIESYEWEPSIANGRLDWTSMPTSRTSVSKTEWQNYSSFGPGKIKDSYAGFVAKEHDYAYYNSGRRASIVYPSGNHVVKTSYTSYGAIDTISTGPSLNDTTQVVDYEYAGSYQINRRYDDFDNDGGDIDYDIDYDEYARADSYLAYQGGTEIIDFDYDFDDNGNINTQTYGHKQNDPVNSFDHDSLNRLTDVEYYSNNNDIESFGYDDLGNRNMVTKRNGTEESYLVNEYNNQYINVGVAGYWHFNENTGVVVNDYSGNDYSGVILGNAGWSAGKVDNAIDLDGNDDYINLGKPSLLDFSGNVAFTVSAWIKPDEVNNYDTIIGNSEGGQQTTVRFNLDITNNRLRAAFGDGTSYISCWSAVDTFASSAIGIWHHVMMVSDGNEAKLFINGQRSGDSLDLSALSLEVSNANWCIGRGYNSNNNLFNGKIDEVMVFNHALTDNEVSAIYSDGDGIYNTVEYDLAGNIIRDQRGYTYSWDHDNHLTLIERADATPVVKYVYDALGRRIIKTEYNAIGEEGYNFRYIYNGWQLLQEDVGNYTMTSYAKEYVYGNSLDEVVMFTWFGNDYPMYYLHDHLNSPVALIAGYNSSSSSKGDIVERYEYAAYGKRTIYDANYNELPSSYFLSTVAFTGQRIDSLDNWQLDMMYYKNRWYDSHQGRFISCDPLHYVNGLNMYQYSFNNPLIYIDIFGTSVASGGGFGPYGGAAGGWGHSPNWNPDPPDSVGLTVVVSGAGPTSHEGFVYGLNAQFGGGVSGLYTISPIGAFGFDYGISFELNMAWGSGPWDGPFTSVVGSYGPISGSGFTGGDWDGVSLGYCCGLPGVAIEETMYEDAADSELLVEIKNKVSDFLDEVENKVSDFLDEVEESLLCPEGAWF